MQRNNDPEKIVLGVEVWRPWHTILSSNAVDKSLVRICEERYKDFISVICATLNIDYSIIFAKNVCGAVKMFQRDKGTRILE